MPYVPKDWLSEHVTLPEGLSTAQLAEALVKVGLEEEQILPSDVTGDLVCGRVLSITEETHSNGKTIRYCRVDVGEFNDAPGTGAEHCELASRGIICGALNFGVADHVVVALPGAVLPGPFEIAARRTYGHISDGMICSERELGLGEAHDGIIVLERLIGNPPPPGTDLKELLGIGSERLEINVTPDRGYCFSMRGVAREYSHSTGAPYTDPASLLSPSPGLPADGTAGGFPVRVEDEAPLGGVGCDRIVLRIVRGIDPAAPTPLWMRRRLQEAGMRPISLAVDVTNYVMLDLGQPMHAYDLGALQAPLVVRRARRGESLTTLDDVKRTLSPEDLLITDDGGARVLGLAGVMGGAATEVGPQTTDLLLECAHFDPTSIARSARRHKLPSESSKRFERGVDPALPPLAAERAAQLLAEYGGGEVGEAVDWDETVPPAPIEMAASMPARLVGVGYSPQRVREILEAIGCTVQGESKLLVTPPTWRPDLTSGEDLVEEVARIDGYGAVPSELPRPAAGHGLTLGQRARRTALRTLAEKGLHEVLSNVWVPERYSELLVADSDPRRSMVRLANPINDDAPCMRSTLLISLLEVARRNVGRGNALALFEAGLVTLGGARPPSPLPAVGALPAAGDLAAVHAAVPEQPAHLAAVLAGPLTSAGALGAAREVDWADPVELASSVATAIGVRLAVKQASYAPWHPGRCAGLYAGGELVGHAGELHPKVSATFGLPARTVAFELNFDALVAAIPSQPHEVTQVLTTPVAKEDFAFVMDADIPAARALAVLREAVGEIGEEVRLFDEYRGLGEGKKSLAFNVRMRAEHTLTSEEILQVRHRIIKAAASELGATLR